MINEEKVRIMAKLASYEQKEGKIYLPVSKYYRSDYIGLALIKNFFLVTIAYVLIVAVVGGYFAEELMDNIHRMNLIAIAAGLVAGYLILLVLYSLLIYMLYSAKYSRAKKSVKRYYVELGKIAKMYVKDEVEMSPQLGSRRKRS